jgi:hypothetical protein
LRAAALLKSAQETPDVECQRALEDIVGQEAHKLMTGDECDAAGDDIEQVAVFAAAALEEDGQSEREALVELLGERFAAAFG